MVAPDQVEAVTRELTQRSSAIALPAPKVIEVEVATDVRPVPCLRLYSVPLKPYEMYYFGGRAGQKRRMTDLNLAHLAFDYGGRRIDPPAALPSSAGRERTKPSARSPVTRTASCAAFPATRSVNARRSDG